MKAVSLGRRKRLKEKAELGPHFIKCYFMINLLTKTPAGILYLIAIQNSMRLLRNIQTSIYVYH